MSSHVVRVRSKQSGGGRGLSILLLLPLMCAVIFFASQLGTINFEAGLIERRATPFQTADYAPWNELVFAPVDDALLTQVALENSGQSVSYSGVATARPTIERQPPVGIPEIIARNQTSMAPNNDTVDSSGTGATTVAQAPSDDTNTETPVDSDTDTPVASDTPDATDTSIPSDTPNPTDTTTPVPSSTAIPTNTGVPPPRINFGANPQSGTAPLTVNFTDLSSGLRYGLVLGRL